MRIFIDNVCRIIFDDQVKISCVIWFAGNFRAEPERPANIFCAADGEKRIFKMFSSGTFCPKNIFFVFRMKDDVRPIHDVLGVKRMIGFGLFVHDDSFIFPVVQIGRGIQAER